MSKKFYKVTKRLLDFFGSGFAMLLLFPLFIVIAIYIILDSKGGIFFTQRRVGLNGKIFHLIKFRTMYQNAHKLGEITVGSRDFRITDAGFFLRKYKLDELPQMVNIFLGQMSFVGPRPEVERYVNLFKKEYSIILSVKPGLTDFASLIFSDENRFLSGCENPEKIYIERIMPRKIMLSLKYIKNQNFFLDTFIIFKTIEKVFL